MSVEVVTSLSTLVLNYGPVCIQIMIKKLGLMWIYANYSRAILLYIETQKVDKCKKTRTRHFKVEAENPKKLHGQPQ
jgi:hypothetical protein